MEKIIAIGAICLAIIIVASIVVFAFILPKPVVPNIQIPLPSPTPTGTTVNIQPTLSPSFYNGVTYVELPVNLSYQLICSGSGAYNLYSNLTSYFYNYTATVYFPMNTYGDVTVCTHCLGEEVINLDGTIRNLSRIANTTYSLGFPSQYYNTSDNKENYISLSFQIVFIPQLNEAFYNNGNDGILIFSYPIQCTGYGSVLSSSSSPLPTPPFI